MWKIYIIKGLFYLEKQFSYLFLFWSDSVFRETQDEKDLQDQLESKELMESQETEDFSD